MLSKIKLDKNRLSSFGKARWNEAHTMRQFKVSNENDQRG